MRPYGEARWNGRRNDSSEASHNNCKRQERSHGYLQLMFDPQNLGNENTAVRSPEITLLDGAMGTELQARGVSTEGRAWSARAVYEAPRTVQRIHEDYMRAGATVHTANTFRTTPRGVGEEWGSLLKRAVALCREVVGQRVRIAGSIAPLEDCWHPERSPRDAHLEHKLISAALMDAGVDILLCETFSNMSEAMIAVECALETGLPVWASFTSGPFDTLSTPMLVARSAAEAVSLGVSAVLVNCIPAVKMLPYIQAIAALDVPIGVRANAGSPEDGIGEPKQGPKRYLSLAHQWAEAGATLIGGCCGIGPAHIHAICDPLAQRRAGDARRASWYE